MRLVVDIETNGLQPDTLWCVVAYDMDEDVAYVGTDHSDKHLSVKEVLGIMDRASVIVAHNGIGYDLPWLKVLTGWTPKEHTKVHDSWIISQVTSYKRPHKHGLAGWGEYLGNAKIHFDDFSQYSEEMVEYCIQDTKVNADVYKVLIKEAKHMMAIKPKFAEALRVEHEFARIESEIKMRGWLFNMEEAERLLKEMADRMADIEQRVEPKLPMITVKIDKEPKLPKFTKVGNYHSITAKHLSEILGRTVYPSDALAETPPWNPEEAYQRTEEVQATLGNLDSVKEYLMQIGWEPDDWNMRKEGYEYVRTTPKLTSTSLKKLGQLGEDVDVYYSVRNRHSVLRGWIDEVRDGRLRGRMWTCGTPTFRVRHEVITNIPAVDSLYGKEMRSLLVADVGSKIVGADSAGNQMRGLCHYVNDDEFTHEVIEGDVHQRNADVLGISRGVAKGFLYAFLFGAGDRKLGQVITGAPNAEVGKEARKKFANSIPGLKNLKTKIDAQFHRSKHQTNEPWLPGLDGRKIYVGSNHQCLNYLLQAAEGVTMKAAMVYADKRLKEEGIPFEWRLFYHDEIAAETPEEHAERVLEIFIEALTEAPKAYGVMCMSGDGTIGNNYADVH